MSTKKTLIISLLLLMSFSGWSQACLPPTLGDGVAFIRTFDAEPGRTVFEVGQQYIFFVTLLVREGDFELPEVDSYEWRLDGTPLPSDGTRALILVIPPLTHGDHTLEAIPLNDCGESNENERPVTRIININNPCEADVMLVRSAGGTICADGSTSHSFVMQNTTDTFIWEVDNGGVITPSATQASVIFVNSGNHTITATNTANAGCIYTISVNAESGPDNITSVEGVNAACELSTLQYTVIGADEANSFSWSLPAGISANYLDAQQREAELTFSSQGTFNVGITPANECGSGAQFDLVINVEENLIVNRNIEFNHVQLQTSPTDELILNTCDQRTSDCRAELDIVELRIALDLGDEYQWGEADFSASVDFTVVGTGIAGDLLTRSESISVSTSQPEALFAVELNEDITGLRKFTIQIDNYTVTGGVDNYVRFSATYDDHYQIDMDQTELSAFGTQVLPGSGWDVKYAWSSSCGLVNAYQLRLLKVFDGETVPSNSSPRWANALIIGSESAELIITMAEGSGQYAWQVRPVGNKAGGTNNPENLREWPNTVQTFAFTQPDEDKNYIYSRTFTEGNRVSEQLTFADGLQRVNQQQTRLNSSDQVVATQTLQDYTGRDAIQSLPAPVVGKSTLGYEPNLMTDGATLYSAESFDADNKVESPDAAYLDMNAGDSGYYGGADNGINADVADAEGVPYTRSLFMNDGTGRLRRQGGVGAAHSISSPHTVRYFYTGVAQQELDFMFGSEAPVAANTYKELTVDANNTTSVSYQNKDGKTIATALVIGTGNTNLDGLDSRDDATKTITENITEKAPLNESTSSSKKPLVFTLPSGINVNYTLSPTTINDVCNSTCKTCDYVVTFILHDMEDPANTRQLAAYTINADAVNCAANTTYSRSFTESVDAGSYTLEKRVRSLNRSGVTGNLFIDDHLNEVRDQYTGEVAAVFDPVDDYIRGETIDLEGLYAYLDAQAYAKIDAVDGQDGYYEVPVGCDGELIIIPILVDDCDQEVDCSDLTSQDFVQYFLDYWDAEVVRRPRPIGDPDPIEIGDFDGTITYEWLAFRYRADRGPVYLTKDEFNTMMANMLQELDESSLYLYDCQMVWKVWKQQVQNYSYLKGMTLDPDELPDEADGLTYEYNLIDNFFQTIEIRLKETETPEMPKMIRKEGFYTSVPGDAEKPYLYKLFYYNAADERMNDCMTGYIGYYNSLETTTSPCDQANVTDQFLCLPYSERQTIYNCIKYGAYNDDDDDPENENLLLMIRQCHDACENKRPAFRQAVIDDIHNQDLYVEGDAFLLEVDPVTGVKRPTGAPRDPAVFDIEQCEIEAMEQALVDNCRGYCLPELEEIILFEGDSPEDNIVTRKITDASIANLQKVLTADFEVSVNTAGETACASGEWDYLDYTSITEPELFLNQIQQNIPNQFSSDTVDNSVYLYSLAKVKAALQADNESVNQSFEQVISSESSTPQLLSSNNVSDAVEYEALKDFFLQAGGPNWPYRTGWDYPNWKDPATVTSADFSDWYGVLVENGDVVNLRSQNNLLTGVLSSEIVNLTMLKYLGLRFNSESAVVPSVIGDLSELEDLYLQGFQGQIPDLSNLATNLKTLSLNFNNFEGQEIPLWLDSDFVSLERLYLQGNDFQGNIPFTLGEFPNIVEIYIRYDDDLTGTIPSSLLNNPTLKRLDIAQNGSIIGPLPEVTINNSRLENLGLVLCSIDGQIPDSFEKLTSLKYLNLFGNELSGSIPDIFSSLPLLKLLNLGSNRLEGSIPGSVCTLSNLEFLDISSKYNGDKKLTSFPTCISNLIKLVYLNLSYNDFNQPIPSGFGDLELLRELLIYESSLIGELPSELGSLNNLERLVLSSSSATAPTANKLTGGIPLEYSQLGQVEEIRLRFNSLNGTIPSGIFSIPSLEFFWLSGNSFSGSLPTSFPVEFNLDLNYNYYEFGPLENVFNSDGSSKINSFTYGAQTTILGEPDRELIYQLGPAFTLPFNTSGINNLYQWQKFNGLDWDPVGTQTSNSDLFLTSTTESTAGVYRVEVTNTIVTGLTLYSHPITLVPEINNTCFVKSLCFRFGDPITGITIPEKFEDYVFEATPFTCEELNTQEIVRTLDFQQNEYIAGKVEDFRDDYYTQCADATQVNDDFEVSYDLGYHHYTLYYYDRAGNLMRTVPPLGFNTTDPNDHHMATDYHYNSLGQLVKQNSPDGGETYFYYNDLGQLRFSQNAQQALEGAYSYTKYDNLGRIVEVGESTNGLSTFRSLTNSPGFPQEGTEKTVTVYTEAYAGALTSPQRFLQNRVSYTYLDEDGLDGTLDDRTHTIYSYDPHGNVEWLVQLIPGLPLKLIEYEYDLISGNVLMVSYNPGEPDQFYHKYEYDGDNRIIGVMTSPNGHLWDTDATYEYYAHGPLKSATIGQDKVQQLDYVYTIHGWLKAINDPVENDIPDAELTGADAFAMALHYYSGDYRGTASVGSLTPADSRDLYNGNISAWEMATHASDDSWMRTGFQYTYDELNRIRDSRFNVFRETTNFLDRGGFQADFTLDANGNLKTLNRNDIDAVNFDALTYHYNITENNQLLGVTDAVSDPEIHPEDLESQSTANYSYDEIGNLTADAQAGTNIEWTVYGKVDEVTKGTGGTEFTYDAAGNRVKKHTTDEFGNTYTTFYIRDASGNILSTYRSQTVGGIAEAAAVIEVPIYGSDRLGTYTPGGALENNQEPVAEVTTDQAVDSYEGVSYLLDDGVTLTLQPGFSYEDDVDGNNFSVGGSQAMEDATVADVYTRTLEKKQYELKDHLGNVRAVITDRKLSDISGSIAGNFRPQIASASAYYPYGMDLPTVRWAPETVTGTIEPENAPEEILNFDNYTDIDIVPDVNTNNNLSTRAFLLTGADGNIMGLAKSYKVQAGDKLSASVSGKYMLPNDRVDNLNVAALLVNAFINTYGGAGFYEGQLLTELGSAFEAGLASIVEDKEPNGEVTAGLSWLAFDNDFTFTGDGGFINLTAAANEDYEEISIAEHILDEDGYVFVYTSNESAQTADVYFDDLMVTLEKLIPDEAYDPDLIAYRYGFNGKEKDQMGEWGGSAAGSTVPASYPVVWTNLVGVDEQDGDIIQNVVAAAWDNAGASSENVLSAGEDGWLTFTVNESSGTTIIGFAVIDTDQTLNNVDHGILIRSDGKLNVLESGIGQIAGPERPDYSIGDELRIERANNEIIYFHNGVPIHTSGVSSNADLIVDAAIYYPNGRISEVEVSFGTQEQHDAAGQGALTAALTASYPLDGNANDVSGNGQNGTVNGAVLVADRDGNANSAYALDGEDDYLNIADNSSLDFGASDFTVSFWVQKQQATIGHTHVSGVNKWNTGGQPGTNEWSISIGDGNTNSDKPLFAVESGNDKFVLNAQTELTVGEWHHLLGVRRGDQTELYIDGVIQGTLAIGNITINDVGLPVYIGRLHAGHFSDAIFDDVFIFNRALAQTEIQQLASGQTPEEIDAMNQQSAEVASLGLAHYDYGFRIYNPALGRFLSVDPLTKGYPMLTPYQYASNTPIYAVDLDGLEGVSWSAVFKAFGVDIEINKRDSRDLEEEAAHQNELATGRARREKLGDGLQKVYDGQKAVLGFLPGASSYYSLVEGDNLEAGANLGFDLLGGRILGAAFKGLKSGAVFLLKKVTPSTNDVALDVVKYVKFDAKFSDEVADLVEGSAIRESSLTRKIKEVITFTKTGTMSDALEIAKSKVGDVTEPFINKLGPNKGRITGQGTESNHWRLDWSDEIGTHINWETATEKGAIPIKMSKEVYEKTLNTAF